MRSTNKMPLRGVDGALTALGDLARALAALITLRGVAQENRPEVLPYIDEQISRGTTLQQNLTQAENAGKYIQRQDGLGFIPLVPIAWATGAAAVAAITKYVTDAYRTVQATEQVETLIKQGINPTRAAEMVFKTEPTIMGGVAKTIPLIALAGLAFWLFKRKK